MRSEYRRVDRKMGSKWTLGRLAGGAGGGWSGFTRRAFVNTVMNPQVLVLRSYDDVNRDHCWITLLQQLTRIALLQQCSRIPVLTFIPLLLFVLSVMMLMSKLACGSKNTLGISLYSKQYTFIGLLKIV
jgi:hypothetical protein